MGLVTILAPQVATTLELEVGYTRKLVVRMSDGHQTFTTERCPRIPVQIGKISTTLGAYILELGRIDIILRID